MARKSTKKSARAAATKAKARAPRKGKKAAAADEEEDAPKSVVGAKYKQRYAERGDRRNCGDWLATVLKDAVLDENKQLDVARLEKLCAANGVDATYANRSPGWQGRMRMTLGLKLRPVVAAEGALFVPDGRSKKAVKAPREWVAAHTR